MPRCPKSIASPAASADKSRLRMSGWRRENMPRAGLSATEVDRHMTRASQEDK
jgi:hypothetical protein